MSKHKDRLRRRNQRARRSQFTWPQQLATSLRRYSPTLPSTRLIGHYWRAIWTFEHARPTRLGLTHAVERALFHLLGANRLSEIRTALSACASPIEEAMLFSLAVVAVARLRGVHLVEAGHPAADHLCDHLIIVPQSPFGFRRLDFLLSLPTSATGERRIMAVECDGHRYHERTEEQARRDRQRDRDLQGEGYLIFRFTGAEIWADAMGRADEAIQCLASTG